MRRISTFLSLALLVALFAACGGGGGAGAGDPFIAAPGPDPSFEGDWHLVMLTASGGGFTVGWGTAVTDAAGAMTTAVSANADGVVATGLSGSSLTTVSANGTLTIMGGGETIQGGITRAGDVAAVGALPGSTPFVGVFLRKAGTLSAASLSGAYHAVRMQRRVVSPFFTHGWRNTAVTFDGLGTSERLGTRPTNRNGAMGTAATGTGVYSVAADGTFGAGFLTPGDTQGGVLAGGAALIHGGGTSTSFEPLIAVCVPASGAASNARFTGTYAMVGMQYDYVAAVYRSTSARLTADGAGSGTMEGTQSVDGAPVLIAPTAVTWSVAADGELSMTLPDGDTVSGGISPDGRIAVLGGATQSGMDPALFVLVRVD